MTAERSVTVRRATLADLRAIVPLFDAYRRFYAQPSDRARARAFLRDRLTRGDSTILLATDAAGSTLGFAQLYPSFSSVSAAPILILNDLFVVPAARRRGVAARLLRASAEHGRETGAVRLTLSTGVDNGAAQALYLRERWVLDRDFQVYTLELHAPEDG